MMQNFKKIIFDNSFKLARYKLSYSLVLLFALIFLSQGVFAGDILKNITYKKKGNLVEITAELDVPFSYVKHFPRKRGKIIQIQIKADAATLGKVNLKRRELIQPDESAPVAIRDVIYEGNVRGGPYLVFRFKSVVDFSVEASTDAKFLKVMVKADEVKAIEAVVAKVENVESDADKIMKDARFALTNSKNSDAILLFSKLLTMTGHKYLSDAKEYLGLARERNGQLEMAKKEYEDYLKLYPKERRSNTVRQRLMTLNARLSSPKRNLKESKRQVASRSPDQKRIDIYGRVSQTYYYSMIKTEGDSALREQQNTLLSFFDATRRERDELKETRLVFSGSHEIDILDSGTMEPRVRSIYGEYKGKKNGLEFTLGRQTVNSGGVLGRFDGGLIGTRLKPKMRGYLVGGWPVDFINHQEVQTDKPMFGGRLDFDEPAPNWKMSTYAIQQNVADIVNRQAVGGDVRYFFKKKIFYSLVDYDVSYGVVNFLTFHYGWQATPKTKFDVHVDRRRSPVMLTTNALQGLSVQTITPAAPVDAITGLPTDDPADPPYEALNFPGHEFKNQLSLGEIITIKKLRDLGVPEAEIRKRAVSNTGSSTLVTLTARHDVKKDLTFNSYLTISQYKAGERLEEIDENAPPEDTSFLNSLGEYDFSLSGQLIQNNFFKPRGILIGGGRVSKNTSSRRVEMNGTFRTPLEKKWWVDVKMRAMFTNNIAQDLNAIRFSPRLKVDYRHTRKLTFDSGLGVDFNKSQFEGQDYSLVMFNAGFRYLF